MTTCPTCGSVLNHDETTLGGFLRARREERGWSLRDVAKISDGKISCPYLSQVENGNQTELGASKVLALSAIYAVDIGGLVRLANGQPYAAQHNPLTGEDQ